MNARVLRRQPFPIGCEMIIDLSVKRRSGSRASGDPASCVLQCNSGLALARGVPRPQNRRGFPTGFSQVGPRAEHEKMVSRAPGRPQCVGTGRHATAERPPPRHQNGCACSTSSRGSIRRRGTAAGHRAAPARRARHDTRCHYGRAGPNGRRRLDERGIAASPSRRLPGNGQPARGVGRLAVLGHCRTAPASPRPSPIWCATRHRPDLCRAVLVGGRDASGAPSRRPDRVGAGGPSISAGACSGGARACSHRGMLYRPIC